MAEKSSTPLISVEDLSVDFRARVSTTNRKSLLVNCALQLACIIVAPAFRPALLSDKSYLAP